MTPSEGFKVGPKSGDIDTLTHDLWGRLPFDQREKVLKEGVCDIDPEFLGFIDVYERLSHLIPLDWTVLDLGCAYAPQCFYFEKHKEYIGVDIYEGERFKAPNTTHYIQRITDFVWTKYTTLDLRTTFAICSYVPDWHGQNRDITRKMFTNCFVYYPATVSPTCKKSAR